MLPVLDLRGAATATAPSSNTPMTETLTPPPILENMLIGQLPQDAPEIRLEPSPKRIRAYLGGVAIADSSRVMMMHETSRLPVYYFPIEDVRADTLRASSTIVASRYKGDASYFSITAEGRVLEDAGWRYLDKVPGRPDTRAYIAFHWNKMDAWFEEDEEVFAHARDPYHRIDVLDSSRQVRIVIGGRVVAETNRARFLFETHLPPRYYIPQEDVHMDLLTFSQTQTRCAYKGQTSAYWQAETARGLRDVAWTYDKPTVEASRIAGMVAFFNERVEAVFIDGVEQPGRRTPWS